MIDRPCVISLGVNHAAPPDYPEPLFQDYKKGIERITGNLAAVNFDGEFLAWTNHYPSGVIAGSAPYFTFKPFCFAEARLRGFDLVLWVDSSILIKRSLEPLFSEIRKQGYLIYRGTHSIGEYCKDEALDPLGITREESFRLPCCWACVLGLDLSCDRSMEFLEQWKRLASDGITFPGPKWSGTKGWPATASSDPRVKGHRHDQTVASVLALRLEMNKWKSRRLFFEYFENDRHFVRRLME